MPRVSFRAVGDPFTLQLQRKLKSFDIEPTRTIKTKGVPKKRRTIYCALTVAGHPYWWALEYGTGSRFKQSWDASDPPLIQPTEDFPHRDAGRPQTGSSTRHPYLIVAGYYREPKKRGGAKRLAFFSRRLRKWVFPIAVEHPGAKGLGIVRRAFKRFERRLTKAFAKEARSQWVPDREDLVEIINTELEAMLEEVIAETPEGDNESGDHLKYAWGIIPAK